MIPRAASLLLACCELSKVHMGDMVHGHRHKTVIRAREKTVGAFRYFTYFSFPEIARAMGRKNHSTTHEQFQRWLKLDQAEREAWLDSVAAALGLPQRIQHPPTNAARAASPPPLPSLHQSSMGTRPAAGIPEINTEAA